MILVTLVAAAALPAIFILLYVYKKDRTEPEPMRLLIKLILMGFLATVFAVITELLGEMVLAYIPFASEDSMNFWKYLLVVGLSEELFKYILMRRVTWKNEDFNCTYDGVVYAVFTSLGFAILENVFYIIDGGLATAVVRAVTAIPGHASFGVFMGVFYAIAKKQKTRGNHVSSRLFECFAIVLPVLAHGIYDYSTTLDHVWVFILFIILMFIFAGLMIRIMSGRDTVIAGSIPAPEKEPVEETPTVTLPDDGPTATVGHVIIEPARPDASKKLTNYRTGPSNK